MVLKSYRHICLKILMLAPVMLIFSSSLLADSGDFVFETDIVRYVISPEGISKSLREKKAGREWLKTSTTPFAAIKKNGKIYPVSHLRSSGSLLRADFGQSGVQADFKITGSADCIEIKLVRPYGEDIEEIRLIQLKLASLPNAGSLAAVRWNEFFSVSLMGLSDRVDARLIGENSEIVASIYPEFGMQGESVSIIAVPTPQFLNTVQSVERNFQLPSPKLAGKWAKDSPDVRESYLFTDLTEANTEETIRYAKLAGIKYIMIYSGTWSSSLGSYPINFRNFPGGEDSLKAVIDKCHDAGLKVGMHMLTSFVGKNDPLVRPYPDPRLLKDAEAKLSIDIGEKDQEIIATAELTGFPGALAFYGSSKAGRDVLIDEEIIQYRVVGGPGTSSLLQCTRGYAGTRITSHKAGAKIYHLAERYGSYLVDLRTPLKDELAERVAGLINRCGFDMIYFDGGEVNSANGAYWYWVSQQQMDIWKRTKRDLLVQGSVATNWTWHIFARGTSDDYAAVAPKQFLDYHKIAVIMQKFTKSFLPAELGWWGFLDYTPHHPATSPDEVEYYAVRMLALDAPVSIETNLKSLRANGRTVEMLKLLGQYEKLRLQKALPIAVKEKLRTGEWHLVLKAGKPEFHPVKYEIKRLVAPEEVNVHNVFGSQKFKFRLQAVPSLAPVGDRANIPLLPPASMLVLKSPAPKTAMPGALADRIEFPKQALDLSTHRALAVRVKVDGPLPKPGEPCAVLNIQLEASGKTYRDHYIDLDFTGERTIILPEPNTERMLPEFRPALENYAFKAAMYNFDYKNIVALNLRWMRQPFGKQAEYSISLVEALSEIESGLDNPILSVGSSKIILPVTLRTGDYAEYWGEGEMRVFDRNGVQISAVPIPQMPVIQSGENKISLSNSGPASAKLTTILLGDALTF